MHGLIICGLTELQHEVAGAVLDGSRFAQHSEGVVSGLLCLNGLQFAFGSAGTKQQNRTE
jgi:hypothetical protein